MFSSEEEDLSVEGWDEENKGPNDDVVEEPERAVDGASESRTELRGVVEVIMVETEEKEKITLQYQHGLSFILNYSSIS